MNTEILEEYRTGSTVREISQRHGIDLSEVRAVIEDGKIRCAYELGNRKLCRMIQTATPPADGFARKICSKKSCRWRKDGACVCVLPRCLHSL